MGTKGPTSETVSRRQRLIDGLESVGGEIVADDMESGGSRLDPAEVAKVLGIKLPAPSLASFLRDAERDGIITQRVDGRRKKAIYLVHGATADANYTPRQPTKRSKKYKRRATTTRTTKNGKTMGRPRKVTATAPIPALGSNLRVFFASEEENGQVSLGLRGEEGSWSVEIRGFAKAES